MGITTEPNKGGPFTCIECGKKSNTLVTTVGPHMELTKCSHCSKFVSIYVEYEIGLLLLDVILLKLAAFRHILQNTRELTSRVAWRFVIVYVTVASYLQSAAIRQQFETRGRTLAEMRRENSVPPVELRVYIGFLYAVVSIGIRYSALLLTTYAFLVIWLRRKSESGIGFWELLTAFCIADFGNLISVLFIIWSELSSLMYADRLLAVYLWIAHAQALRAKFAQLSLIPALVVSSLALYAAELVVHLLVQPRLVRFDAW